MAKPMRAKSIDLEVPSKRKQAVDESASKEKKPPYNVLHRITSALWADDNVPYSLYEVSMKTPHLIDVLIVNGKNVTKGWYTDCEDNILDPYIMLRIPNTPNGVKRTKPTTNPKDPFWNEHFYFLIDPRSTTHLEITLIDSSYIKERNFGVVKIQIDRMDVNDVPLAREMTFLNGAKVYARVWRREVLDPPEMRNGQGLTEDEVTFLERRRHRVMDSLNKLLVRNDPDEEKIKAAEISSQGSSHSKSQGGSMAMTSMALGPGGTTEFGPASLQETPTVAILGSGGGYRACAGFAGAMIGLQKIGVLDCTTYIASVSGSAWYTSFLYSQPNHTRKGPAAFESLLRERMTSSWHQLLLPRSLYRFVSAMAQKASGGQPIGFPDFFGGLIGEKLLGAEFAAKPLSAQRVGLEYAAAPLPLYTCIHINKDIAPSVFQEWIEFTPYNVWLSKYALSMPTELFGCKWFCGVVVRKFAEVPMSYLMGLWGSAFSVLYKRLIWEKGKQRLIKETAVPDKMALQELSTYRAYKEGYPPMNNDTGSSDVSIIPRTSDEDSTSEEDPEELERQAREVHEAQEQIAKTKRADMADRFSRTSKKGSKGKLQAPSKTSQQRTAEDEEFNNKLEMIKNRLKIRRFRKYLLAQNEQKEASQRSFWRRMLDSLMSVGVWDTRAARAGLVFNPLRGLVLKPAFAKEAVETTVTPRETEPMKGAYVMADPRAKRWFLMDPGLALNLPFPPLLRPQRAVDVFITFDFSTRFSDEASPFDHILLAEHWARIRRLRFPPVSSLVRQYLLQPPRESYIFEDKNDPLCPLIILFPLVNNLFRKFRSPGVPRISMIDKTFGDFPIFSDPNDNYSITNMCYDQTVFDRLLLLMAFNVEQSAPALRAVLQTAVQRKRSLLPPACQEVERLKREEEEQAARVAKRRRREARRKRKAQRRQKLQESKRIFMAERPSMLKRRIEAEVEARQKRLEESMRSDRGNPALARALYHSAQDAERNDPKALITQLMWLAYQSARAAVVRTRRRLGFEHASSMIPHVPSAQLRRLQARSTPPPPPQPPRPSQVGPGASESISPPETTPDPSTSRRSRASRLSRVSRTSRASRAGEESSISSPGRPTGPTRTSQSRRSRGSLARTSKNGRQSIKLSQNGKS